MTAPPLSRGRLVAYGVFALLIISFVSAVAVPAAESLTSFKSVEAGKKMQILGTQGWSTTSKNLYFTSYSRVATGDINDYANVKLGSMGYVMPRLGWCSDTATSNLTMVDMTVNTVTFTVNGAGTQRVWCPDRGEPADISGDDTHSWDSVNQVITTTTTGADTVTLRWYSTSSAGIFTAAQLLITLFPLIIVYMIFEAIRHPDYRRLLITLAVIAGVLVLLANLIYAWGI